MTTRPEDPRFIEGLKGLAQVGRYEIVRKVGQGGMAVVYLGRDPYIKRNVAIKMSVPGTKKAREQFFVEAQSAGRLSHRNIVAVYDAGIHGEYCYMTMEYVDGGTLEEFGRPEKLMPVGKVVEVMFTVANALDYAHEEGILHRDFKPSNIMLDRHGVPKLTDFGVAQFMEDTAVSGFFGTPRYMSPEKLMGGDVGIASDVWSLGCVLYNLLTGSYAFPGRRFSEVRERILETHPPPVSRINKEAPKVLDDIVNKALAKDVKKRYQTCLDFAYELRVVLRGIRQQAAGGDKAKSAVEYVHKVPFFHNFNKRQVEELLAAAIVEKVKAGEVVVTEGEIDDTFYVILSGSAKILKGKKELAVISVGECFGEMAYIGAQARVATVEADTDMVLMKISATLLDRAPGSIQLLFFKNFANFLVRRLSSHFK